jgi:hypothetical protein
VLWGLTSTDELVRFDSNNSTQYTFASFIVGLQANEHLLDIDYNPNDGRLYGMSNQNRIYTINTANASASGLPMAFVLSGTGFGIDWNPVTNQMQVASNTRQSFHVSLPANATADPTLAYAAGDPHFGTGPSVTDLAYTNSIAGSTSTQLFGLDNLQNTLVTVDPTTGAVHTIGVLNGQFGGPNGITGANGFDISGATTAYAAVQQLNSPGSTLYSVDLATGQASPLGQIGGGGSNDLILGIAAVPVPEPASMALLGGAILLLIRRRRQK